MEEKPTRTRSRTVIEPEPLDAEPKPKRSRSRVAIDPEPQIEAIPPRSKKEEVVLEEPKTPQKRTRKKPEPGSVPPKEISFTTARGTRSFTAHKQPPQPQSQPPSQYTPYGHLHGNNRYSQIMSAW